MKKRCKDCEKSSVIKDAKKKGISPYLLMKRKANYRKKIKDCIRHCGTCREGVHVNFKDKARFQCQVIGITGSDEANVDENHVCDYRN
ncbi:MAG: hypothetical protein ACXAAH_00320 [Promethearchaeota archaeon]|jgi:hypothetical protein